MRRIATGVAAIVLVATGGVLAWRLNEVNDELEGSRLDALHLRKQAVSLSGEVENLESELALTREALEDEIVRVEREHRRTRRALRLRQPCDEGPHLWLLPDEGPVGTHVEFVGDCFVGRYFGEPSDVQGGYGMFLIRQLGERHPAGECEQIVFLGPLEVKIKAGRARGSFTIGGEGSCFQHQEGPYPVIPGSYHVGVACHACFTNAHFTVTP